MLDLDGLAGIIRKRLNDDLEVKSVEVEMPTLDDAVHEAACMLGIPIYSLDYEILEHKTAFLTFGKNLCRIRGYERVSVKRKKREEEEAAQKTVDAVKEAEEMELIEDMDGEIFIKRLASGIHIKVTPPEGTGAAVCLSAAKDALAAANIANYDANAVKAAVAKQSGKYVRIGDYANNPANNAAMSIEVTEDEMRAFLYVNPPGPGGTDIMFADIKNTMKMHGVTSGADEEFLETFADKPVYREKVCIAKGTPPVNGINSFMQYFFETDQSKIRLRESSDGKVDYKELNIIQNVRENQVLAIWNNAEPGKDGSTVTGRILMSQPGKETAFDIGNNVRKEADGRTIVAAISGQVMMVNGKISVEPVLEIAGDVGVKTGNIDFNGAVFVKGDVIEGFKIKASGSIDINGTINKATVVADGDIIVKQGIYGKEGTFVQSGCSVWAKFIENGTVKSGNVINVTDGIINSNVDAAKKIFCSGKRASIVGGRLRASEEISCKTLGAVGGSTETICEVAFDPESRSQLEALQTERATLGGEFDEVALNARTLDNNKKTRGFLPDDKEEILQELLKKRESLAERLREIDEQIAELQQHLSSLVVNGRVSASVKVYPGVCVRIRDAEEKIRSEYKAVTFVLDHGLIASTKYAEPVAAPEKPERK